MPQHDYLIDNEPSLAVRLDWNDVLEAAVSNNEGTVEPAANPEGPTRAGMFWFDTVTTTGRMKRRNAQDTAWITLATDADLIKKTGGVVSGDLRVAGVFSNPEFNRLRASFQGPTAPPNPVPGMLWFDTAVVPNALKVRDKANAAWGPAAITTSPVFTVSMTINDPAGLAAINLISTAERRRLISDAAGNRMSFYGPNDALVGYITDAGDYISAVNGSLVNALNSKQNNLGFLPVRTVGGTLLPTLGWGADGRLHSWIGDGYYYHGYLMLSSQRVVPVPNLELQTITARSRSCSNPGLGARMVSRAAVRCCTVGTMGTAAITRRARGATSAAPATARRIRSSIQ